MDLRQLLTDERAVPPVIGVILMVAITVILAAVIAAFVLGLGDTDDVAPNPTFDSDYDSDAGTVEILVTGGDSFDADRVSVTGNDFVAEQSQVRLSDAGPDGNYFDQNTVVGAGDRFTVVLQDEDGNSVLTVTDYEPGGADEFDLQLIWRSDDGDTTATIFETTGPDV